MDENSSVFSNYDFRNQIDNYLRYWKWFILTIIICGFLAYLKLNLTSPEYRASSSIQIKGNNSSDESKLAVFQDLGIMSNSRDHIEDEIEILKSKSLIYDVANNLNLNVQFFNDKNKLSEFIDNTFSQETNFYENELYSNPPFNINFFTPDSIINEVNSEFIISVISPTQFKYTDKYKSFKSSFGEKITSHDLGEIIIIPNSVDDSSLVGSEIFVKIIPLSSIAYSYSNNLNIEPKSDFSSILDVKFSNSDRKRAQDFLRELINQYNNRSITQKELLTKSTSDFVSKRLEKIEDELSDIDITAESFKTKYRLSDVTSQAGLNLQSNQEIERQIVTANTELEKIGFIKDFVKTSNANELIPTSIELGDNTVNSLTQKYNELMLEKKRYLETSTEKNPIVSNINEQLRSIRDNISQGLNNLESSQKISIDALTEQDRRINSRLYSAPKQERELRTIQRQQQIKEALFLYLLQKREEIAITLGVAEPNAKIIDQPISTFNPVSPKKSVYYLAAILFGLLIPFSFIYIKDFLDTKVGGREDIEKLLNIPILGDIPKVEGKNFLITENDHSSMAEAFRILRTNLGFITTHNESSKVIFITSTIAHEGKSFVSSNLAVSLALAGKKTLLIGMDIRAPRIKNYLNIRGEKGITNYIVDSKISLNDIILDVPKIKNLNLISSGDIAPNPAELLMNSKVKELFDKVKKDYDYIIVDTAASSIVTDTILLRNFADVFIFVIRANFLDKRQLNFIKAIYKENKLPNLALLINGVDNKRTYQYGYGYGFEYEKNKVKWWQFYK